MATTVAVGSVSVSTSGALTGQLLDQFAYALSVSSAVTIGAGGTLPAATGSDQTLIIPASLGGTISVPSGYESVIYQGTAGILAELGSRQMSLSAT